MTTLTTRKKWLALGLSLVMPGLGQLYCGDALRGACLFIFFIFGPLLVAKLTVLLPDSWMLPGIACAVVLLLGSYLYALVHAFRLAANTGTTQLRAYNRPYFYLAAWLAGAVCILITDQYLRDNVVEAYRIAGASMSPAVLPGDYVLVKKPAYRNRPVRRGDIVIATYPDDRSVALIRRIAALPGDSNNMGGGTPATVPHGTVLVEGLRVGAWDSSTFGPLDMRDIVGRVTQVYFSRDGLAVRWSRLGMLINP